MPQYISLGSIAVPHVFCSRDAPPIMPTDTQQGYKQMKAQIGQSRVRPWKWMPFTNPARKVGIKKLLWANSLSLGGKQNCATWFTRNAARTPCWYNDACQCHQVIRCSHWWQIKPVPSYHKMKACNWSICPLRVDESILFICHSYVSSFSNHCRST